jgi:tetratricopeptide (TPR) repeat protein
LLRSVIQLIEEAATTPGGRNFETATDYLNEYFEGTNPAEFRMPAEAREFLSQVKLPESALADLELSRFTARDARHIEDCLLYQAVASRVAGTGDPLTQARRLFDWVVRQVMLVNPEALGVPNVLPQAQARPFDVLVRGMATEGDDTWTGKNQRGYWAERSWVFLVLCRQLGIDAGLVTLTPKGAEVPRYWICGAAINDKVYLFDARLGLEVRDPDGQSIATLDQLLGDPSLLDQFNLPGDDAPRYDVTASDLADSTVGIALDATLGYLSPRMRLLQSELAGKNRMILYRDPAEQHNAFARAMGDRYGGSSLWLLPIEVEARLFTDPRFVEATQQPLLIYSPMLPLLKARLYQLRGDLPAAIQSYVNLRFRQNPTLDDRRTPIPTEVQRALDMHSTYYLALCHLEQGNLGQAENLFQQTIRYLPDPQPGPPFYSLTHYGAVSNLGRLHEDKKAFAKAIVEYRRPNPTFQHHGNLVRAERLAHLHPEAAAEAEARIEAKADEEAKAKDEAKVQSDDATKSDVESKARETPIEEPTQTRREPSEPRS